MAAGLQRYGYHKEASRIALKWVRLVACTFDRTGLLLERYYAVDPNGPTPGRYLPNVFAAVLIMVIAAVPSWRARQANAMDGRDQLAAVASDGRGGP